MDLPKASAAARFAQHAPSLVTNKDLLNNNFKSVKAYLVSFWKKVNWKPDNGHNIMQITSNSQVN